jgi:hypothetical protein
MNEGYQSRQLREKVSIIQGLLPNLGWRRFLHFVLLGLIVAVSLHAKIAVGSPEPGNWKAEHTAHTHLTSDSLPASTTSPSIQVQQPKHTIRQGNSQRRSPLATSSNPL